MASTISLGPAAKAVRCDCMNGRAKAKASSAITAARKASSSRYCKRRCLMELWVRRSKNISEANGRGVVLCFLSRCSQTGKPTATTPANAQGARNPIYILP